MLKHVYTWAQKLAAYFNPLFLTRSRLNLWFYFGLLAATALGAAGAAGDVSWHFSRFFDEFSLPHNLAAAGDVINVFLLAFAFFHRKQLSRGETLGLRLNALALIILTVDIPLDLINHEIFGIDLTTWSPSHLLLFFSGTLAVLGMMIAWVYSRYARVWWSWLVTMLFATFFLSAVLFPLYQQEYAAMVFYSLRTEYMLPWHITPELLHEVSGRLVRLLTNWTPDWLYVTYQAPMAIFAVTLSLLLILRNRWLYVRESVMMAIAVGITLLYLLFRLVARAVLGYFGLPTAELPIWILMAAIVVGLVVPFMLRSGSRRWEVWRVGVYALAGAVAGGSLFGILYGMHVHNRVSPTVPPRALAGVIVLSAIAPLAALYVDKLIATAAAEK